MLRATVFGAMVLAAEAACPNQCSGHGYCDEKDRCICFKSSGTKGMMRPAYVGADCSQRVCPYGKAHDLISDSTQSLLAVNADTANPNVAFIKKGASSEAKLMAYLNNGFLRSADYGLDVNVVSVDTASASLKFQYKWSNERTFNKEYTAVVGTKYTARENAFGVPLDDKENPSGLYIYWGVSGADLTASKIAEGDRYYLNVTFNEGVKFVGSDMNTAHGNLECSGRGSCDRTTGTCKCAVGYTGDACQRTECPNDCSGHGTCQSLKYFVNDGTEGTLSYNGFDADAQMGCKCDAGFRGADCSQIECPSGIDPMGGAGGEGGRDCSGRGSCDYTTGTCNCFKGYFGERCEEQSNLV